MQKRQHQAQCKHAYLGIALVYSSCKIQRGMLSFPRRRESIATRSAAVDFRPTPSRGQALRGNDGFLSFLLLEASISERLLSSAKSHSNHIRATPKPHPSHNLPAVKLRRGKDLQPDCVGVQRRAKCCCAHAACRVAARFALRLHHALHHVFHHALQPACALFCKL